MGKTTTVANTAAALTAVGLNVVVIDLDPQAHLTIHLGVEPEAVEAGSYEVLTQSADFEQSLMFVRQNLWLLAANINLVGAETELVSVVGREIILREALQASRDKFDYCLIDCAPSLGLLTLNALAAAEEVLIPLQPHFLALQGFGKLLQTVDLVNKRINPALKVAGVLLCMFDTRASLPSEVRADIERFLEAARGTDSAWAGAEVLPTFIRRNIKLAEAPSYGQTIFEYDPTCNGAQDYRKVARYMLGLDPDPQPETPDDSATEPQRGPEDPADTAAEGHTESEVPADVTVETDTESDAHVHPDADADPAPESHGSAPDAVTGSQHVGAPTEDHPSEIPNPQSPIENPPSQPPCQDAPQGDPPQDPPIEIRSLNLPAPRCYWPQPLWTAPEQDPSDPTTDPDPGTTNGPTIP